MSDKVPVYCLYSSQVDKIFDVHFYPSFMKFNKNDFDLNIFETTVDGNGNYNTSGYLDCLHHKTEMMLKTVKDNIGRSIVWTDVDIKFFSKIDLTSYNNVFTVLKEDENPLDNFINPAFCKIDCNDTMIDFFEKLLLSCKQNKVHDMDVMNYFRHTVPNIKIDIFDFRYIQYTSLPYRDETINCHICNNNLGCYKCTHQLVNLNCIDTSKIILYHANCTVGCENKTSMDLKLEQLDFLTTK